MRNLKSEKRAVIHRRDRFVEAVKYFVKLLNFRDANTLSVIKCSRMPVLAPALSTHRRVVTLKRFRKGTLMSLRIKISLIYHTIRYKIVRSHSLIKLKYLYYTSFGQGLTAVTYFG